MAVLGGPSAIVHYCWRRPRMQEVLGPCSTGLRCRCVKSCNTPWGESAPDSTSLLCKDRVCSMISMFCCFCIILHHSASFCIILHHSASFCIILHHSASFCIILHHSASFCISWFAARYSKMVTWMWCIGLRPPGH